MVLALLPRCQYSVEISCQVKYFLWLTFTPRICHDYNITKENDKRKSKLERINSDQTDANLKENIQET